MPQPPTAEHPPPAPDWILGDDGHWRPPPFTAGGGPRRQPPTAGLEPPTPPSDRSTMRGRMGLRRRDIAVGTLGLVIAGVGLFGKLQDVKELIGLVDDVRNPTTVIEDACPSTQDVEETLDAPVTAMTSEPFSAYVGDFYLPGVGGCAYGAGASIGAKTYRSDDIELLSMLASPLVVSDPGIGAESVRVDDTTSDDEGTVLIVFRTDDGIEGMVRVDGVHADRAEDLARKVHDRLD